MMMLEAAYDVASVVNTGKYLTTVNELCDQIPALRPELLRHVTGRLKQLLTPEISQCTKLLIEEEKGAVIGAAVSLETGIPLAMARSYPYNVPGGQLVDYTSEYLTGTLHVNGLEPGDLVCVLDDTLSTGGTLVAVIEAARRVGAEVVAVGVVVEKHGNGGRELVQERTGVEVRSVIEIVVDAAGVKVRDDRRPAAQGFEPGTDLGFLHSMRPPGLAGRFVVVEGIDGVGKSTLVHGLAESLRGDGIRTVTTFQPTKSIRQTEMFRRFAEGAAADIDLYRALYMVTTGDRLFHVVDVVLPALKEGSVVVCDRYTYSTVANMIARGHELSSWFCDLVTNLPRPDLTLLLTASVETAAARVRSRRGGQESAQDSAYSTRLQDAFVEVGREAGFVHLDTDALTSSQCVEQTHTLVRELYDERR